MLKADHFFSPSEIGSCVMCPTSWWKDKTKQVGIETETKYRDFGSLFHGVIKDFYNVIPETATKGSIQGTLQTIIEKQTKFEKLDGMKTRLDKCTKNFLKFELIRRRTWKQYKPTLIEEKLAAMVNNINYVNIVDAYWEKDEHSVDWKTGMKNTLSDIDRIQGRIGQMVLHMHGKKCTKTTFCMLYTGMFLPMPETSHTFVEERVKLMFEYVRTNTFPKNKTQLCSMCRHVLSCTYEDRGLCIWM